MKAMGYKKILLFAVILIIFGAVLSATGALFNGRTRLFFANGWEMGYNGFMYSHKKNNDEALAVSEELRDFTSIDMDINVAQINIKQGKEFYIDITENYHPVKFEVVDNTLYVTQKKIDAKVNFSNIGMNFNNNEVPIITITIPKGTNMKKLSGSTGVSGASFSDVFVEEIDLHPEVGNITFNNVSVNKLFLNGGVGNIMFNGKILELANIDGGVGNIKMEGELLGDCELDQGVGDINLNLKGNISDYNITGDKGLGNVRINGKNLDFGKEIKNPYRSNNKATNNIKVDGGTGNLIININ